MDLDFKIKQFIADLFIQKPLLARVVAKIHESGGRCLLVGGAVRDLFLGHETKDLDLEVYGLQSDQFEQILSQFGPVQQIGKAFGVYLLLGLNADWALPRTDSAGRKPVVEVNPNLDFIDAFKRRDLTVNAMGINLKTSDLIDPFGGLQDLQARVLRYVDRDLFVQDPLRFYRVMQFIARLEMTPDENLNQICASMDLSTVSQERIETEFYKLFLKSCRPSASFLWLKKINRLSQILPELFATINVPQEVAWHPEGDVFEHTMQAIDLAARQNYVNDQEKLLIMLAALCHDLGKSVTTKKIDRQWRSFGHAKAGVVLAQKLLGRITSNQNLIKQLSVLVQYHMEPLGFINNNAGLFAYKKLAVKLQPNTLAILAKLLLVDRLARFAIGANLPAKINFDQDQLVQKFIAQAKLAGVLDQIEEPVLQGRDLIAFVKPGPDLGKLLAKAYQMQLETGILDKQKLIELILK